MALQRADKNLDRLKGTELLAQWECVLSKARGCLWYRWLVLKGVFCIPVFGLGTGSYLSYTFSHKFLDLLLNFQKYFLDFIFQFFH